MMTGVHVHKAVEPQKLSVKGKKLYAELVQDLILTPGSRAWVQPKYDGVYAQFIHDGKHWGAWTRTGNYMPSVGQEVYDAFDTYALPERVYNGELWLPSTQHSVINGRSRKQSPQWLEVKLFDAFMLDEPDEPYSLRYDYLWTGGPVAPAPLLPVIEKIFVEDDLYDMAKALKHRGSSAYDGLILRDSEGLYVPGKGLDGQTIKIKPRKEGDFRVVGTTRGKGNRLGGYGALIVDLGGGVHNEVGSGLSLREIFEKEDPTGRIATVEYLDVTSDGHLREPSFKTYRFDKTEADVLDHTQQLED